jgi:hypothetical protein
MTHSTIKSPVYINVGKGKVAVSLCVHVELYIPLKAIQMVKISLQLLCSMQPDDKDVIHMMEPAQPFVGSLCYGPLLNVFHKEVSDHGREWGAHRHSICLLIELATKERDVEVMTCLNKAKMSPLKCWLRRLRDSTISTWVNRGSMSKLTITSSSPTHKEPEVWTN